MIKKQVIHLYELTNEQEAGKDIENIIESLLEDNDLSAPENVPEWFTNFLQSIIDCKEVDKTSIEYNEKQGDIDNFITDLESIIEMECDDYGEAIAVDFPTLLLHAVISREGNYYEIKKNNS